MPQKGRAVVAAPAPRTRSARPAPPVKVPLDRFPGASSNPALQRALQIHFGMQAGLSRDEAVRRAEELLGPRGKPRRRRPRSH
ncbi:MAG: hypothetical protein QOD77_575 [Thermoplasmata archaeon]|jgi:hypothetical protein|nr:hypothetical protein [Thermoplasmata archaeon]